MIVEARTRCSRLKQDLGSESSHSEEASAKLSFGLPSPPTDKLLKLREFQKLHNANNAYEIESFRPKNRSSARGTTVNYQQADRIVVSERNPSISQIKSALERELRKKVEEIIDDEDIGIRFPEVNTLQLAVTKTRGPKETQEG